ncbi:sensor histidine kinase [Paenibacillus sp. NFR01]|uniref:sensor histidine kinase n=1 Tax=Paenibacillus sp. NFR01 TaxID=1566279 RepID=UPI0008C68C78|nr:GHKL domain-containing protein [Paenibacillus sp. NFR01]SET09944.1 Sensor_kinase_SpoOB-type, alpha-helical domain [Paenibacillus sp. NFR01]
MGLIDFLFRGAIDRRIAAFQNDLMEKHIVEVENIYKQMRGWRHDYHNHIQMMKAFRSLGQHEQMDDYLNALESDLGSVDTLIKSGNVMVDAILNSKLSLANARMITVHAKAVVPKTIAVAEIDLCVILGNLLDNAIEACLRTGDDAKRFIRVYIDLKRNNLYISVTNGSGAKQERHGGRYASSKGDNHGFGLQRVDRIVDKYAGYIKRRDEDGAFSTEVLLPL